MGKKKSKARIATRPTLPAPLLTDEVTVIKKGRRRCYKVPVYREGKRIGHVHVCNDGSIAVHLR